MAKAENRQMRRRLVNAYASSIVSISLVLVLIGAAAFLLVNARSVSDWFKESMQLSVTMKQEAADADADAYAASVLTLPYVKSATTVTREQGTAELKAMLGEDFLDVFETSPVPVSVDVTLHADYVSPDSLAMVTKVLSKSPLVDTVECQQSLVDALNSNLRRISLVLGAFILVLLFISFVLINNTVRLNVFARRFTIHTMKLVGATRGFIRRPFMNSALVQGLVSSLLAIGVLYAVFCALRSSFGQLFSIVTLQSQLIVAGTVLAAGILICLISTFFVVGHLVDLGKDELYY